MATRMVTVITDDIDGTVIDSDTHTPTQLAIDGKYRTLDLSDSNRAALYELLAPYIEAGRRTRPGRSTRRRSTRTSAPKRLDHIREWARENGYSVADRGRISQAITEAYNEAHSD